MSLPDGVTTCLVTYGPITDTFGNPADSITVEVVADRTIVHVASGRTMFKNPVIVEAETGGVAQLPVPHTDQAGFHDPQQNDLTNWYYTLRLTARFGNDIQTDSKTFQPIIGQTVVDADLLPSNGMLRPGVTAPSAAVTSVNGQTGAVTIAGLPLVMLAKNPDLLVTGALTYASGLLATAVVEWPDGKSGVLTITSRQASTSAVTGYTVTHVDGATTLTYTQPTITRDVAGNATLVPQITVA
jgi:hypothetical protein